MERAELVALGKILRERREQRGLTQEELAESAGAGLSVDTISNIERGRTRPYRQTLEALIAALALAEAEAETAWRRWREVRRSPAAAGHDLEETIVSGSPLIGRGTEVAVLERHLNGEGQPLLLLAGEPGIGKSRLLKEATALASGSGYSVLVGGCQRRSGEEPYAPLVETLAQHLETLGGEERRVALDRCEWLAHLLPELPAPPGGPRTMVAPGQERRLIFDAVRRFMRNIAGPKGTLLVLDDLQWAGGDALDLLRMLVGSPSAARLRVVGAYRDTDVVAGSALLAHLADLASAGLVRQVALGPLTETDARALIVAVLTQMDEPALARTLTTDIVRRCGGVPFFLTSCVQGLQTGAISPEQPGSVPWDLAQAVRQRIAALPPESGVLLGVAAVIGREVRHGLLAAVSDFSEPALLDALDAAFQGGLLVEGQDYRFAHDVIREAVEADIGLGRRMTLHRRVAEALESEDGDASVELLAYHYARSGRDDKAVPYIELAGDRARDRYAGAAAVAHYLDLVERLVRLGWRAETARAYEKLGETLHVSGRYEEAVVALENAAERYHVDQDLDGEVRAVSQIGQVYHRQGRLDEGIARLAEVTARLDSLAGAEGPRDHWRVWMALSASLHFSGRYEEQLTAAERALRLAEGTAETAALAETKLAFGAGVLSARSGEDALPILEEAVQLGEAAGALEAARTAGWGATGAHIAAGRFGRGREWSERGLFAAERVGDPGWVALLTSLRGFCLFQEGKWTEARSSLERGAEMARPLGASFVSSWSLLYLGQLDVALGAWDAATRLVEEALGMARDLPWNALLWCAQACLAELDVVQGHPDRAIARLEPTLAGYRADWRDPGGPWIVLAGAYLAAGDIERAETTVQLALAETERRQDLTRMVEALRVRGMVLAQQGFLEDAESVFQKALALAHTMPYPYAEAKILTVYGALQEGRGDYAGALERMQDALTIFRRLGAEKEAQRTEGALCPLVIRNP